jgi:peptidoglycan hydrolase-like protein with peptidoglycan-binding domain
MGMQEHAGEMEQKPEDDIQAKPEEDKTQTPESTEEASSEVENQEEKKDAKEQGPTSKVEEVVADAVKKYGPQPPPEKMMELALIFGYLPSTGEYVEFMNAVQKFCGNEYAGVLEGEFAKATAEPEVKQQTEETQGGEPTDEGTEAEAAEDQQGDAKGEQQQTKDPATLEQQGPAAEEVPPEIAEEPAVKDELATQAEEQQKEAPPAEDVKAENAEEVQAEPAGEDQKKEEEVGPPQGDLRRGDHSPEVEELQKLLIQMGYMTQEQMDTGPGIFGPRTEHALKAYQADLGLPSTGFYGPKTRESLAKAAEPPSKVEKIVIEIIGHAGPKPDFGILIGVFLTLDAAVQEEFMGAVGKHCGEEHAAKLKAEIDNAASAQAETKAPKEAEKPAEEPAPKPVAEEGPEEAPKTAEPVAAPEEVVETQAPQEEIQAVQEEVVAVAPEVVPEEAKEQVQSDEPAAEQETKPEEEAVTSPVEEVVQQASEDKKEEQPSDVTAEPTAAPEEKQQAAEEQQEQLAKEPEEAQVEESEAPEQSEEEVEAKKEEVTEQLDEEVSEAPDNTESIAALQELLEEADQLMGASAGVLQDPVLDTTQDTIQADAEAMLENWDGDIDNMVQQLNEMADRLTAGDLGQTPGMEDAVAEAADTAADLREQAAELQGAGPANVDVNVQLTDGDVLSFEAPIGSRDTAVADILAVFLQQLELREAESEEGEAEAPSSEAPVEV